MEGLNFRAINLTCVCVDGVRLGEIDGRIYHRYAAAPVEFCGMSGMLNAMEDFFDAINYPQAAVEPRSFRQRKTMPATMRGEHMEPTEDWEKVAERRGDLATFLIHVQGRQNASWQGAIQWAEREVTQHFRSALELMKLIDSCASILEGPQEL